MNADPRASISDFVALAVSLGGHEHEALSICAATDPTILTTDVTRDGYVRTHRDGRTVHLPHGFIPVNPRRVSASTPLHCPCCGTARTCFCATGGRSGAVEMVLCTCKPDPARLTCTCGRTSHRQPHAPDCLHSTLTARATVHRGDCPVMAADFKPEPPPHAWRFRVARECLSDPNTPPAEKIWRDRVVFDLLPEYEGPPLDELDINRMGTAIVLDTETTGIRAQDVVIELAAARVEIATGRVIDQRVTLIHPGGVPTHPEALRTHGITDAMLARAPAFADVWPRVVKFIGADRVIAHNATFDRRLLEQTIGAHNARVDEHLRFSLPPWPWIDSLPWARVAVPEAPKHGLPALRDLLGVTGGTAHRAMGDVQTLCGVVAKLAERSREVPEVDVWGQQRRVKAQVKAVTPVTRTNTSVATSATSMRATSATSMRATSRKTSDQSGVHTLPTLRGLDGAP